MAGMGALSVAALGAVTAPTSLRLASFTAITGDYTPWGLYDAIPLPSQNAVIFCHGVEAMRYVREGSCLILGMLPPKAGMTATSTATAAAATLTFAANPANGDYIRVGSSTGGPKTIRFVTTIDTTGAYGDQVKIGANLAATIANLNAFVNGTHTQGTEGWDAAVAFGLGFPGYTSLPGANVSVTSTTATTAVFTSLTPGTDGNAYIASFYSPGAQITSFGTGSKFTGGAAGTGTAPASGTYRYALAHLRSADDALSAISYPEVEETQSSNVNVSLAAFPSIPSRTGADYYRVWRTKVGGRVMYKLADTTSTSATDSSSDDTIGPTGNTTDEAIDKVLRPKYDPTIHRPYVAGWPEVGRYGALWRSKLWTVGALRSDDYAVGTASVAAASDSVTISSTGRVKEDMIGRVFRVAGHPADYLIVGVNPSTRVLTLNRNYGGGTDAAASYTITDARSGTLEQHTEPGLMNNWPVANSLEGVVASDPVGATGHVTLWDSLVVFTRSRLYRITGSSGAYRVQDVGAGFGCYGNHAVQVAEGVAYWIGPDGAFRWSNPDGLPEPIGKPRDETGAGIFGTLQRVTQDEAGQIVSNYNQSSRKIRWWLPLDGSPLNNWCLRLDLQTQSFALQEASGVTAAATVPGADGTQVTIVGDVVGRVWEVDAGWSDGAYGFEPKCVVSSYTASTRTLAITGTTLPTSGDALAGVPVLVVSATDGTYQRGKVATNTSGAMVLCWPLTTAPSANDIVIVGAYALDIQSARFDNEQPELTKWAEGLTLAHEVESAATEVWCGAAADNDDPACFAADGSTVDYGDPTFSEGEKHYWLYTERGRALVIRFLAFVRGHRLRLRGYSLAIRTPNMAEVEG